MERIPRIIIPKPVIRDIPPPVIRTFEPPVVRGIQPPVIDVPNPVIEYPTIDVPTEQDFRQQMSPQQDPQPQQSEDTRELPETPNTPEIPSTPTTPTINIGGVEAPLPEPAPLITAGATALVTTAVTLGATILMGQFKDKLVEPMMKRSGKKKKIKIKQIKPVLHYVMNDDETVDIIEYSAKGTKVVDQTGDVEKYLRDQVEIDSLYEYDNKIIIDDVIKDKFTKEGAKRFKSLFAPAKSIVKKLSSKISF